MTELQIPRVGCGAVVRDADGRILLIQRGRDPERGHWGLPGGKVDWMETVEAAVVRETREETALEVTLLRLLCVADHFEPTLAQHWVAPIFEARHLPVPRPPSRSRVCRQGWAGSRWMRCPSH